MYTALTILILIVCVLLVLVVLVQNPKGGGLASGFTGAGQVMGVKKTTEFIEKLTWGLVASLVALCIAASFSLPNAADQNSASSMQEQIDNAAAAPQGQQAPAKQAPAQPAQQQAPGKTEPKPAGK
jgi:preprotein translocase subunit SecG